ncbi:MAG: glycosyltransferase family 2 protein [Myxococcales bacterium]|nr:glycosyltransferase family 2 protein [Myxococcales bacterium]
MQPPSADRGPAPEITVVVPVYNEVGSIPELYRQLTAGCAAVGRSYEILVIDDGSRDGSADLLDEIAEADPRVEVLHFRRNFGKSPALAAGFERARGEIVLTLDGDLQDDPAMIPDFVRKIDEGADLVSGYKQRRHDPLGKTLPSKFFNAVVRRVSGIKLRDFNCGFKAYRAECVRELSVYGGFHRFLPVLAGDRGFRIEELVVNHRPRQHGVSKYGLRRLIDGFLDLLTVLLVTRFRSRPLHFFSVPAGLLGVPGLAILLYMTVLWAQDEAIGTRPLLTLGVLLMITGIHFLGLGLLAELLVRTTLRSTEIYSIRAPRARRPATSAAAAPAPAPVAAQEGHP